MRNLISTDPIDVSRLRMQWHNGEWYYSIVDFMAETLNLHYKDAQNRFHVMKKRLQDYGEILPDIQKLKTTCSDGKQYLTQFTSMRGLEFLKFHLSHKLHKRSWRIQSHRDEVANCHPIVIEYLQCAGFSTQHHVRLPSGHIIDIVAESADMRCVIEVKPKLTRSRLFEAIGQVLCYCAEFGVDAHPAIVSDLKSIKPYARGCCADLGIWLIALPLVDNS